MTKLLKKRGLRTGLHTKTIALTVRKITMGRKLQVPLRFELRSLDSKSRVITIVPWDHI